jgi:hypothetical protein
MGRPAPGRDTHDPVDLPRSPPQSDDFLSCYDNALPVNAFSIWESRLQNAFSEAEDRAPNEPLHPSMFNWEGWGENSPKRPFPH